MSGVPPEIERVLRARGPVIDPPGTKALYAPYLAKLPPSDAELTADIAYGDDERHRLDVYRPKSEAPLPVLVFIHGGGFVRGDKREREHLARAFAREGFVVVVPNYRLGPTHRWPAGALDIGAVMTWAASHVAAHGGDATRIVLAGESAGAAHAAACTLIREFQPRGAAMPRAVALISGVYNARLEGLARAQFGIQTPDPRNEAYFGPELSAWDAASTVERIDVAPFPLWISFAELDPLQMQVQAGELFARLVSRHGFEPALHIVRAHDHLSQLYAIGTDDRTLFQPLLDWMRRCTDAR